MSQVSKRAPEKAANGSNKTRIVTVSGPPSDLRDRYDRILWALEIVIGESQGNGGIYPPLKRKPTLAHVLVRAGLPRSFLEKRNKVASPRDERNALLKAAIHERLGNVPRISLPVPDSTDVSERGLVRQLKEGWHEAELNLVQANADIRALRAQLSQAETENKSLREDLTSLKNSG